MCTASATACFEVCTAVFVDQPFFLSHKIASSSRAMIECGFHSHTLLSNPCPPRKFGRANLRLPYRMVITFTLRLRSGQDQESVSAWLEVVEHSATAHQLWWTSQNFGSPSTRLASNTWFSFLSQCSQMTPCPSRWEGSSEDVSVWLEVAGHSSSPHQQATSQILDK